MEKIVERPLGVAPGMEREVPHLDRPRERSRDRVEKGPKHRKVVGTERPRELNHQRTETIPEGFDASRNARSSAVLLRRTPVVRDFGEA